MPNTSQATRRVKQSQAANSKNNSDRSKMRTAIKKLLSSVAKKNSEEASSLFRVVQKILDTLTKKNIIAANTASRYKKRLNSKVKAIAK
jgi:small subunit ribosomal protein S20